MLILVKCMLYRVTHVRAHVGMLKVIKSFYRQTVSVAKGFAFSLYLFLFSLRSPPSIAPITHNIFEIRINAD